MSLPPRGQVLNVGVRNDPRKGQVRQQKMTMLAGPMHSKRKVTGIVGGLDALKAKANQRAISDPNAKRGINAIRSTKPKSSAKNPMAIGGTVFIKDNISLQSRSRKGLSNMNVDRCIVELDDSDDDIEESRDGEDMEIFCKRMHKRTVDNKTIEERRRLESREADKLSAQAKLREKIMHNFRDRVKKNSAQGKLILYQYEKQQLQDIFQIKELLMSPKPETLLKQISDEVSPFVLLHYRANPDKYVIEITWATPSVKNPRGSINKIKKKVPVIELSLPIVQNGPPAPIFPMLASESTRVFGINKFSSGKSIQNNIPPPPTSDFDADAIAKLRKKSSKKKSNKSNK